MSNKKKKKNSQKQALKKRAKARERRIRALTLWTAVVVVFLGGLYLF